MSSDSGSAKTGMIFMLTNKLMHMHIHHKAPVSQGRSRQSLGRLYLADSVGSGSMTHVYVKRLHWNTCLLSAGQLLSPSNFQNEHSEVETPQSTPA